MQGRAVAIVNCGISFANFYYITSMKKSLFFLAFICLGQSVYAQIQWTKCLGGSDWDFAHDIHQTRDGGYIVAGSTESKDGDATGNRGAVNALVIKLSPSGSVEWQKCYGGSIVERANSVQQTSDGGYIVAGSSKSDDGNVTGVHDTGSWKGDYWVIKLSSAGALEWQRSLGGTLAEEANSIQQTSDGGYIVAGASYSPDGDVTGAHGGEDAWVVKLSSMGAIEWQKALGGSDDEYAASIRQTFDGGYILTGSSYSVDGDITVHHGDITHDDVWVVKLSSTGSIEWQSSLGGSSSDKGYFIQQTIDSGYIITGSAASSDGDVTGHVGIIGKSQSDIWVVKLSKSGAVQWNKCIDLGGYETGYCVQQTTDTGFIVCGGITHFSAFYFPDTVLVVKLSSGGAMEWLTGFGGSRDNYGNAISQTQDGGYVIGGYSYSNDGDVSANHGRSDYWVVKMGSKPSEVKNIVHTTSVDVRPNPATNELSVTSDDVITDINVTSLAGQTLYSHAYNARQVRVDVADLAAGLYLVRINNTTVRKFVKQ